MNFMECGGSGLPGLESGTARFAPVSPRALKDGFDRQQLYVASKSLMRSV